MKFSHLSISHTIRQNSARDWGVLFTFALVLIFISLGWNMYLFNRVVDGESLQDEQVEIKTGFDEKELDRLVHVFTNRTSEALKYKQATYYFIDPSK